MRRPPSAAVCCKRAGPQKTQNVFWGAPHTSPLRTFASAVFLNALPAKPRVSYISRMQHDDYLVRPDPSDPRLTERVEGVDQTGERIETRVTVERALTIFLNAQEIVTAMTINDYPEYLALGYLLNQHMLLP